jgi:hypothetical protein
MVEGEELSMWGPDEFTTERARAYLAALEQEKRGYEGASMIPGGAETKPERAAQVQAEIDRVRALLLAAEREQAVAKVEAAVEEAEQLDEKLDPHLAASTARTGRPPGTGSRPCSRRRRVSHPLLPPELLARFAEELGVSLEEAERLALHPGRLRLARSVSAYRAASFRDWAHGDGDDPGANDGRLLPLAEVALIVGRTLDWAEAHAPLLPHILDEAGVVWVPRGCLRDWAQAAAPRQTREQQ